MENSQHKDKNFVCTGGAHLPKKKKKISDIKNEMSIFSSQLNS